MTDFRSVTIVDALNTVLDDLERLYQPVRAAVEVDSRIETGVPAIDRLLGGIPTGRVTLIAADHAVHAEALAASIARDSPHGVLLAAPEVLAAARTLLAATARVPYPFVESGHLTEADWRKLHDACNALSQREVHLTTCPSAFGILRAACDTEVPLCVVLTPERLGGRLDAVLHELGTEARKASVAVVALTTAKTDDADAVVLAPSRLSETLELVTSDPVDLLRRTTISVDRLSRYAN
ncbi:MAG: DnaB-like helicase terminal domain [Actinomycetia bacterium]|nr:DnaB-like helicase terminal domain [Actinomycetes bacterium]